MHVFLDSDLEKMKAGTRRTCKHHVDRPQLGFKPGTITNHHPSSDIQPLYRADGSIFINERFMKSDKPSEMHITAW